jgi:hypothetical protein
MGKKKIDIKPIEHGASRRATFEKRKIGLLKKSMELSILCQCSVSLSVYTPDGDVIIYSSEPYESTISKFENFNGEYTLFTNDHVNDLIPGKYKPDIGYNVFKTSKNNNNNTNNATLPPPPTIFPYSTMFPSFNNNNNNNSNNHDGNHNNNHNINDFLLPPNLNYHNNINNQQHEQQQQQLLMSNNQNYLDTDIDIKLNSNSLSHSESQSLSIPILGDKRLFSSLMNEEYNDIMPDNIGFDNIIEPSHKKSRFSID